VDGVRNGDGEHRERPEHDYHRFHDARPFIDGNSHLDSLGADYTGTRLRKKEKEDTRGRPERYVTIDVYTSYRLVIQ